MKRKIFQSLSLLQELELMKHRNHLDEQLSQSQGDTSQYKALLREKEIISQLISADLSENKHRRIGQDTLNHEIESLRHDIAKLSSLPAMDKVQLISMLIDLKELQTRLATQLLQEETIPLVIADSNEAVRRSLLDSLFKIDPYKFEEVIAELIKKMGYRDVEVTKKGRDGGVDVIANYPMGLSRDIRTVIQVKRYSKNIQQPVVRELAGVLPVFNADRGLIITTSDFSSGCRDLVENQGLNAIHLINGQELVNQMIKYEIGVRSEKVDVYSLSAL